MPGHNFNAHAKFTILEEVHNKSLSKLKNCSLLDHRENYWILKLQTLSLQDREMFSRQLYIPTFCKYSTRSQRHWSKKYLKKQSISFKKNPDVQVKPKKLKSKNTPFSSIQRAYFGKI